ncbi:hypothetical protein AC578_1110 [Pseudocercospora eumusae]|uniref:Uncharacterized protein n=1 Tax=Pseudocercospora eumusae TaxID=321146 RepID=A0A139HTS0_9PEZI|nr:hypothetical protein AC578_1110 [Pseudocercospora eumusae]
MPSPPPTRQVKKRKAEEASLPPPPQAKRRSARFADTAAARLVLSIAMCLRFQSSSARLHLSDFVARSFSSKAIANVFRSVLPTPVASAKKETAKKPRRERDFFTSTPRYHLPKSLMEASPTMLREDFAAIFGDAAKVEEVLIKKEPDVDSFAQFPHGSLARVKEEKAKRLEVFLKKQSRRKTASRKDDGARGRQQVQLKGDNWILFDVTRGYPPTLESEPPAIFTKYERYEPGNRKIVAYNVESFSVRLQTTPPHFEGYEVQYTKAGPKLVKISKVKEKTETATP